MKAETLQKISKLKESVPNTAPLLDNFVSQVDAAVSLFSHCDPHPGFHAFMNMVGYRSLINTALAQSVMFDAYSFIQSGKPLDLYSPRNNETQTLMDSVFDEAIDEIVEDGFQACVRDYYL